MILTLVKYNKIPWMRARIFVCIEGNIKGEGREKDINFPVYGSQIVDSKTK